MYPYSVDELAWAIAREREDEARKTRRTWGRKPTNAIATGVRRSRSPRGDRNVVAEGGPTLEGLQRQG